VNAHFSQTTRLRSIRRIREAIPSRLGHLHLHLATFGLILRLLTPLLLEPDRQVTKTMRTYAGCMNNTIVMTILREECILSMSLAITVATLSLAVEGRTTISRPPNLVIVAGVRKCATTLPRSRTRTITAEPQLSSPRHPHKPMSRPRRLLLAQHSNHLPVQVSTARRPALNMAPRRAGAGRCATPPQRGLTLTCRRIIQPNGAGLAPLTPGKLSPRSSELDPATDGTLSRRNHALRPLNSGSLRHDTRPPKGPWRPPKRGDALRLPSGGVLIHPTGAGHLRSSSASLADSKRRADKTPPLPLLALSVQPVQLAPWVR
jgi:hypothetical protein